MPRCSVVGCKSTTMSKLPNTEISYFSIPNKDELRCEWLKHCKANVNVNTGRVCSLHFARNAFKQLSWVQLQLPNSVRRHLVDGSIPTENLPNITSTIPEVLLEHNYSKVDMTNSIPTPTNLSVENDILKRDNEVLQQEIQRLKCIIKEKDAIITKNEKQIKDYQKEAAKAAREESKYMEIFEKVFTPGQRKVLLQGKTKTHWCDDDISSAIILHSISPQAYEYLRDNGKYPLPGLATLRDWAKVRHKSKK